MASLLPFCHCRCAVLCSSVALLVALAALVVSVIIAKNASEEDGQVNPELVFELQTRVTELVASNQILTNDLEMLASNDIFDPQHSLVDDLTSSNQLLANSLVLLTMSAMSLLGGGGGGQPSQASDLSAAIEALAHQTNMQPLEDAIEALTTRVEAIENGVGDDGDHDDDDYLHPANKWRRSHYYYHHRYHWWWCV